MFHHESIRLCLLSAPPTTAPILDGIGMGASLAEQSGFFWRNARRIDQMAAANVDPDLLKWGASVSANLRQAAVDSRGQIRASMAAKYGAQFQ